MSQVLKQFDGVEVVKSNDTVAPFAIRIDGATIVSSWSLELIEAIATNPAMVELMKKIIDE
jgi:hypothetical protein